ncbi:secondary thiamine-phosphate synthase enzyme YjbQ [Candidatus Bipolaricaulota bacterium]|nr:secondary thiamine-phosphate synthase enzyme YjbQ [Candidatus Bipolaricaulota bacterium]
MLNITLATHQKSVLVDITRQAQESIDKSGIKKGMCFIYCPHTTAGLLINESADQAVADDICTALDDLAPQGANWTHLEGNSPAHIKSALVGNSLWVALENGRLLLGRWQGIFFCEFDGPRQRKVWFTVLS